ncbi:MAG: DUF4923 family protein [Candidatus Cryptobacteroides sp.]|nr:DUF4923 family protein [Candidatus Cryptobacteroides sp.]
MKKFFSVLALAAVVAVSANAQSNLGGILGNLGNLGNVLTNAAGAIYSGPVSLNGTYSYNGIAVSVTSSEGGIISNLAGSAVTSGIESKADEYLAKIGVKPGAMTWTFNNTDNTFTLNVGGISIPGKYKVGDGEKTVTLTFGKSFQFLDMPGTLESTMSGARITFTSAKAMAFFKKLAGALSQSSSQISSIAKLADGYDNYRIGFKLSK